MQFSWIFGPNRALGVASESIETLNDYETVKQLGARTVRSNTVAAEQWRH
jgi:hypothetical protein